MQTLTDALKDFDLRDYMILKSRKPGPRAKHPDLPTILYASYRKGHGFPICSTVTSFTFRTVDVEKIARMVHGDLEAHMVLKKKERPDRALRGRCKRVNDAKLKFHQDRVEVTTGQAAEKHLRRT